MNKQQLDTIVQAVIAIVLIAAVVVFVLHDPAYGANEAVGVLLSLAGAFEVGRRVPRER